MKLRMTHFSLVGFLHPMGGDCALAWIRRMALASSRTCACCGATSWRSGSLPSVLLPAGSSLRSPGHSESVILRSAPASCPDRSVCACLSSRCWWRSPSSGLGDDRAGRSVSSSVVLARGMGMKTRTAIRLGAGCLVWWRGRAVLLPSFLKARRASAHNAASTT